MTTRNVWPRAETYPRTGPIVITLPFGWPRRGMFRLVSSALMLLRVWLRRMVRLEEDDSGRPREDLAGRGAGPVSIARGDVASLPAAGYLPVADLPAVGCLLAVCCSLVDGYWRVGDDSPEDDLPGDERSDSKAGWADG